MTQPATELRFVKGDAVLGDARSFCEQILKRFRTSTGMQAWNITRHAYAISAYCDDATRTAIEDRIAADVFDCGVGGSEHRIFPLLNCFSYADVLNDRFACPHSGLLKDARSAHPPLSIQDQKALVVFFPRCSNLNLSA